MNASPPCRARLCLPALTLLLALALLSATAHGYGPKAHKVIGELAAERLTPAASRQVAQLLGEQSLADATTWMDEMRGSSHRFWSYDYAANWHFANIAPGRDYQQSDKSDRGDAYMALQAAIAILSGEPVPPGPVRDGLAFYFGDLDPAREDVRRFALRLLLHLAGDLHQPLHLGYEEDRGGNAIDVRWFGESTNLHRVWDSHLVEYPGLSVADYKERLNQRIESMSPAVREALAREAPRAWVDEALAMRPRVYDVHQGQRLGRDYAETFVPVVERQMIKAGLRLAALLNGLFDGTAAP